MKNDSSLDVKLGQLRRRRQRVVGGVLELDNARVVKEELANGANISAQCRRCEERLVVLRQVPMAKK